jgi:YHS domain-containing protein
MIFVLLRLILLYVIVRAVLRLWRGIAAGLREPVRREPSPLPLARDPICGTYVVPANALTAGAGTQTRFFCSEKCRHAYLIAHGH